MSADDRLALTDVCLRYARALDSREWALLDEVFAPDAQVQYPGSPLLDGRDATAAFCDRALSRFRATQHLLGNHEFTIDGDQATGSTYLQAAHCEPSGRIYTLWGTYHDKFSRTPAGWRITERTLVSHFTGWTAVPATDG